MPAIAATSVAAVAGGVASVPVAPGDTFAVFVGGEGGPVTLQGNDEIPGAGGYNGGGSGGGFQGGAATFAGGGGGGASDVRRTSAGIGDRILVAGGGGGGSQCIPGEFAGGDGGGPQGDGTPTQGCIKTPVSLAMGGSQLSGGLGGETSSMDPTACQAMPGALGAGGAACDRTGAGGGGGGGYYGGGGGGWTGGAGGSNLAPAGATLNQKGVHAGPGSVIIRW